ncbi:Protein PLANT CADMIUM RESISTANCE 2 [Tolypocladium capitatum]|uniref:Protein PLANT CADMIUM RESISTANCE 2 n=1 Tax=Tolypocladium capitatum TaxID=45235 RepID=A0A2K3Q957_9HYPO|nr:Protein PLANT CADMIUM RESISTANCE 2 [Tolypocladium capitatum]
MEETKITPAPAPASAPAPAPAPAPVPAPAPGTNAPAAGHNNGPIDEQDLNDWKARFNDVLARPSEHINSKSPETSQAWHAGFFDCFNPIDTCLVTYFLPCVTFGKTHHRLRKNGDLVGWEPINTSCLLFCGSGCVGLHWIPMAMQRQNIREKYNLQGSCLTDLAVSCCCHCCAIIQSDKEAEHQEHQIQSGGVQQQYQANTDMTYAGK